MSALEARRLAFATLVACYHNSFANVTEGRNRHSPEYIARVLESKSPASSAALMFDPAMTSTDPGAIAVGIARRVTTSEAASRSFIDVEIGESAFIVSFDKHIKPDNAASVISACGNVAQLCKAGDVIGEGLISDLTIFAVEPNPDMVESILADEVSRVITESEIEVDEAGKPKLGTGKRFAKLAKSVHSKALAAYIGRKKYGKKKFSDLSTHGKTNEKSAGVAGTRLGWSGTSFMDDLVGAAHAHGIPVHKLKAAAVKHGANLKMSGLGQHRAEFRGDDHRTRADAFAKDAGIKAFHGAWHQDIAEDAAIDAALLNEVDFGFHNPPLHTHAVVTYHQGRPTYVSANMTHDDAVKVKDQHFKDGDVITRDEARQIRHHFTTGETEKYVDKKAAPNASHITIESEDGMSSFRVVKVHGTPAGHDNPNSDWHALVSAHGGSSTHAAFRHPDGSFQVTFPHQPDAEKSGYEPSYKTFADRAAKHPGVTKAEVMPHAKLPDSMKESTVTDLSACPLTTEEVKGLYIHAYGKEAWGTPVDEAAMSKTAIAHMLKAFALPKIPGAKNETGRDGFDKEFAVALKVMRADKAALIHEEAVDVVALMLHKHFPKDIPVLAEATTLNTGAAAPVKLNESALATDDSKATVLQGIARCLLMSEGIVPAPLQHAVDKWSAFVEESGEETVKNHIAHIQSLMKTAPPEDQQKLGEIVKLHQDRLKRLAAVK